MSIRVKKTEHSGAKRGQGALWGRKKEAKSGSNRVRREAGKTESPRDQLELGEEEAISARELAVAIAPPVEQKTPRM